MPNPRELIRKVAAEYTVDHMPGLIADESLIVLAAAGWEIARLGATKTLREAVEAFDLGHLEMNSPEIDYGAPDFPPSPWHLEWISHARAMIKGGK